MRWGKTARLRSLREVQEYCHKHGIKFNAKLFSFSGKNKYEGIALECYGRSSPSSSSPPHVSMSSIFEMKDDY